MGVFAGGARQPQGEDGGGFRRPVPLFGAGARQPPRGNGWALDVVYEATGAAEMSFQVLGELSANAIFVFTGVPGHAGPIEINADKLMKRIVLDNQVVLGTVNAGPRCVRGGDSGPGDFPPEIRQCARFPDHRPLHSRRTREKRYSEARRHQKRDRDRNRAANERAYTRIGSEPFTIDVPSRRG